MKRACDNIFNGKVKESKRFQDVLSQNSFIVDKTSVFYEFRRLLALNIMTAVFNYAAEHHKIKDFNHEVLNDKIRNFFRRYQIRIHIL
jgi:hypothetical protein